MHDLHGSYHSCGQIIFYTAMKNASKKKYLGIAAGAIAAVAAATGLVACLGGVNNDESFRLFIDDDDNIDSLQQKIETHARPNALAFKVNSSIFGLNERIRPGHYIVKENTSVMRLLHRIRNHNEDPVRLVVPSARTLDEMAEKLSAQLMMDKASILNVLSDTTQIASMGYTKETLPCLFIPNTYEVYWDIEPSQLIDRLQKENKAFWNEQRLAKLSEVSAYAGEEMTKEKVVTLASIVDSETANNAEKPNIAALYMNRMRIGMPLQSDPTVKFALQDFALRRIMHKHLNVESPYNTYRNQGLPPGPICVPSIAGIDAVLNHSKNDYIYMCAKEDFSGTHNFAVSYAEHQANAARYTKALNERNIH